MKDNWVLGGVLGGAAMFFWGALSHMLLPVAEMGLRTVPVEAEPALVEAMQESLPEAAVYLIPGSDPSQAMTEEAQRAFVERVAAGPTALVAWNPGPGAALGPAPLSRELAGGILACLIAAWVLTRMAPETGYGTRILVVIAFAGFGVLTIEVPYWTWFSFPGRWFVGQALDQLIGAALAGVVVARHARPRAGT